VVNALSGQAGIYIQQLEAKDDDSVKLWHSQYSVEGFYEKAEAFGGYAGQITKILSGEFKFGVKFSANKAKTMRETLHPKDPAFNVHNVDLVPTTVARLRHVPATL
jgi:hypothetical protein